MSAEEFAPEERVYKAELARLLQEVGPAVLDHWRSILTEGGQQSITVKCSSCGRGTKASIPVADVQQQRLILTFLQEQLTDGGGTEPETRKFIRDTREMSDEDLAAHICSLEAELAAETPERRGLSALIGRLTEGQVPEAVKRLKEILGG